MSATKSEKIKGIARHILTLVGGILIALGLINADDVDILTTAVVELVGSVFVIWGVVASWINKDKTAPGGNAE
jgi:fumarate reductase subunit D